MPKYNKYRTGIHKRFYADMTVDKTMQLIAPLLNDDTETIDTRLTSRSLYVLKNCIRNIENYPIIRSFENRTAMRLNPKSKE